MIVKALRLRTKCRIKVNDSGQEKKECFPFFLFFCACPNLRVESMMFAFSQNKSSQIQKKTETCTLREKCPNTESFLVRIFLYQSEYRKTRTRKNSVFEHISRSDNSEHTKLNG